MREIRCMRIFGGYICQLNWRTCVRCSALASFDAPLYNHRKLVKETRHTTRSKTEEKSARSEASGIHRELDISDDDKLGDL